MTGEHLSPGCPQAPLSLFDSAPFILLRPETVTYRHAMEICASHGFTPKVRFSLDQLITSYHFAGKGLGIAFVSDCMVKSAPPPRLSRPLGMRRIKAGLMVILRRMSDRSITPVW